MTVYIPGIQLTIQVDQPQGQRLKEKEQIRRHHKKDHCSTKKISQLSIALIPKQLIACLMA